MNGLNTFQLYRDCQRVWSSGIAGHRRPTHTEPEGARPYTPRSCSVHASRMHRSDARGSWQLLLGVLVQLWKEPPLHPDLIVQHGPERTRIGRATQPASQHLCIAEVCVDSRGLGLVRLRCACLASCKHANGRGNTAEVARASERNPNPNGCHTAVADLETTYDAFTSILYPHSGGLRAMVALM
jgi:hypothetical protein